MIFLLNVLEMEADEVPPFNDWEALVVEEFESKPILETHLRQDQDEIERDVIDGISLSGLNDNGGFSDNENAIVDEPKKSSSCSSSSPPEVEFRGRSIAERRAAALLDSPVMLPNCQAQPSPTTGTLHLQQPNHESLLLNSVSPAVENNVLPACSAAPILPCPFGAENKRPTTSKSLPDSTKEDSLKSCAATEASAATKHPGNANHINLQPHCANVVKVQLPRVRECVKGEAGVHGSMQEDHKSAYVPAASAEFTRNAEDGYSWRKYGQKYVKGSEYPRSYYKCNNSSCHVKKKVERSHDGEITEIIYKGAHNHPKPHPRISLAPPAASGELLETSEGSEPCVKVETGTGWRMNNQLRSKESRVGSDWRRDGLERTSSTSVLTDIFDPLAIAKGKSASVLGSGETPELSSRIPSQDGDGEDGATQGSTSQGDDADGDESEPKRRKKEVFSTEAYLTSRSNREPRVIVQIESEIDVLDDGYCWRKYGQKVVKGNPNLRSYYKCTSAGCPVRKHVERASDDIKSVLTTYEGKHNHEVPTTKTSGLPNASSPPDVSSANPAMAVPRNPNVPTQEIQVQDLPLHCEMNPALGNDFMRSNLLGDFVSDIQTGPYSIYPMKFPPTPLPSSIPYGSFIMNSNGSDSHRASQKFPRVMPDFPMSIPLNVPRSTANVALSNNFHSYNHSHAMQNATVLQSSIGDQHIKGGDLGFLRPKEEKKDDIIYDSYLATADHTYATSSRVFCGVMGNFPS